MNRSTAWRAGLFGALTVLVAGGATAYVLLEGQAARELRERPPEVAVAADEESTGPLVAPGRLVFRHSGVDSANGLLASVPVADLGGPRTISDIACERVDASRRAMSCLVSHRGVVTTWTADALDASGGPLMETPLPGIPSRTRLSDDAGLVATTSFVTGHDYMSTGFSTATVVREFPEGRSWGNLESFALTIEGREVKPVDRNIWGVTFTGESSFLATVATGGRTWLVRGDLDRRTLVSIAENAECPSVSPDGSLVAFKVDVDDTDSKLWQLAVHDLASGERRLLSSATQGLDDQVEWLDDETILYAVPRPDEPGISDVWAAGTDGGEPRLVVEQASSPSVVR